MKLKVINPPDRIYLQVGEIDRDCEFKGLEEVTWCADPIYETDIEYRLVRRKRRVAAKGAGPVLQTPESSK